MRVFIVSKGHVPRMHLFDWFVPEFVAQGGDVTVVTHFKDNARAIKSVSPRGVKIVTTNSELLCDSRNAILDMLKRGEWYVGMDDNIPAFQMVHHKLFMKTRLPVDHPPPRGFASWRAVYRQPMSVHRVVEAMRMVRDECNSVDTVYGGFASMENPFFRARKWSYVRFVKSKAFVMQNSNLRWQGDRCGQDSSMSVEVVAHYGCVAVCNWILPVHKMYEPGGIGSSEERRKYLNPQLDKIVRQYPGLVMHGRGQNTALAFRLHTLKSVAKWRAEHGYA